MNRFVRKLTSGSALALALALLAGPGYSALAQKEDKEVKEAQKDVLKLAKDIEAGNKVDVAAIRKKYEELEPIMHAFKPSTKGGIGIGKPGPGDSIEQKIINLGKRSLSPATLSKEKADLIKMAYINIAIGQIANHYPPKAKGGKGPREWKQYNEDMIKSSQEFIKAVKADDTAKLKTAAANINSACNNCHSDFRDTSE